MKKILRYLSLLLTTGSVTTLALSALSAQDLQQYNPARNQVQKDAGLLGGEGGQVLQALAVSSDASLLIVGSDVAGLRRSENQGELWQPANAGYTPRGNVALAIDPNNADRVIALGGNSRSSIGTPVYHGIYLSTDRGVSWQQVLAADICGFRDIREQLAWDASSLDTNLGGSAVAYWSRMDTSFCQAGGSEIIPGLYKTTDGGQNWALLPNSGNYSQSTIKIHPTEGFVYAARADGFYKSTDGGLSFTLKEEGEMKGLDVVATQPDRVYLSKPDGVYVSEDAGENFTKVDATNFPDESSFLKVSPANPDKMMMQVRLARFDTPWYYSHDGGVSWTPTVMDTTLAYLPFNGGRRIYPVWHPTDEDVVWAIGGDWVTKSTDGGQTLRWSNQGSSMIAQSGYFAFSPYNPDIVAITNQDYNSSYTTDGGNVWKYLQTSAFGFGGFAYGGFAPTEDIVFVRDAQQARGATTLVISSDGGDTFDRTQIPVEGAEVGYADPLNEQTYFLGNLRSGDGGDTWQPMDGCQGVFTHNRANPEELFGVDDTRLVRSLDGGQNWEVVFNVTTPLWDIAHDQVNDKFFAVSEFKFYAYQRTSNTLTDITARTPKDQLGRANRYHTVAVDPVETNVVYVGNHRDIYASDVSLSRSLNGGQSWKPLTPAPRHGNLDDGAIGGYEVQCVRYTR